MLAFVFPSRLVKLIIIIISLLTSLSASTIFLPSFPTIANYFEVTDSTVKLAIPIYLFGSLLSAPILGVFSDFYDKLFIMFCGIALFFLGTILCIYSPSIQTFLMARFIQGCGAIVSPVVGWALLQDLYSGDKSAKVVSWVGSILATVPLIAPGIGGYIHIVFGWKGNFFFILIFNLIILSLILIEKQSMIFITKSNKINPKKVIDIYAKILSTKKFLYYLFCYSFLTCGEWCYLTIIPFYFEKFLCLSPNIFGLYFSYSASYYFFGTFLTPILLNFFGTSTTLSIGTLLSLIGAILLFCTVVFAPAFPLLISSIVGIYFLGIAIVWGPSTSESLQCFENIKGTASAVRSLLVTAASAFGGVAGSFFHNTSLIYTSLFLLVMALGSRLAFKRGG